jgi:hypothetical protein
MKLTNRLRRNLIDFSKTNVSIDSTSIIETKKRSENKYLASSLEIN